MCFSPYLGVAGGGGTKGSRAHNLLMQLSGLGSSKMEISESDFFDTLTIQNDQISYVLAPLPSSRCFAEGNRISQLILQKNTEWARCRALPLAVHRNIPFACKWGLHCYGAI